MTTVKVLSSHPAEIDPITQRSWVTLVIIIYIQIDFMIWKRDREKVCMFDLNKIESLWTAKIWFDAHTNSIIIYD